MLCSNLELLSVSICFLYIVVCVCTKECSSVCVSPQSRLRDSFSSISITTKYYGKKDNIIKYKEQFAFIQFSCLFFCIILSFFSSSFMLYAVMIICTTATYIKKYYSCNKCIPFSVSAPPSSHHPSRPLSHLYFLPFISSLPLHRPRYLIKRERICDRNDNFILRSC